LAELCWLLTGNAVRTALAERNRLDDINWDAKQFIHFQYADGAKMFTVGWVIHNRDSGDIVTQCAIDRLTFYKGDRESFRIDPPPLTPKEVRALNGCLPSGRDIACPGVSDEIINRYKRLYRYYPAYYEILDV